MIQVMEKPLPTYVDYANSDYDAQDRRPYIVKYLGAKVEQLEVEGKHPDAKMIASGNKFDYRNTYLQLATLAFNFAQAQSRLNALSQSIDASNSRRISAQKDEIAGRRAKATRFLINHPFHEILYSEMVSDFSLMAVKANMPNEEEQNIINLGNAGRIGEVRTTAEEHTYAHEDPYTRNDSAFN